MIDPKHLIRFALFLLIQFLVIYFIMKFDEIRTWANHLPDWIQLAKVGFYSLCFLVLIIWTWVFTKPMK